MKGDLVYKTKGTQKAYYRDGNGDKVPGEIINSGTLLLLRNRCCHLLPEDNVFEIADQDDVDKYYVVLDEDQVEYVEGNQGVR